MYIISIIPARAGSKGIPGKNIIPLKGKPLISYSIETSLACELIDETFVSTDDTEIACLSKKYGASVPILRPKQYAMDNSTDAEFIQHWIEYLESETGRVPDLIVQLRPTSPVRQIGYVRKGIQKMIEYPQADSLRCLSIPNNNPFKMWTFKDENSYIHPLVDQINLEDQVLPDEPYNAPRQKLPIVYWQNGYMDIIRTDSFIKTRSISGKKILGLKINHPVVDIDNLDDLKVAEDLIAKSEVT